MFSMEVTIDPADKAFIDAEAKRCRTSVSEIVHRALQAYRAEPELPELPDLKGRSMLDYLEPIDSPGAVTDGAANHDYYLHEAFKKKKLH